MLRIIFYPSLVVEAGDQYLLNVCVPYQQKSCVQNTISAKLWNLVFKTISKLYVEHMFSNDVYERVQQTLTFA